MSSPVTPTSNEGRPTLFSVDYFFLFFSLLLLCFVPGSLGNVKCDHDGTSRMVSEGGEGMGNGLWWELGVDMRRVSAVLPLSSYFICFPSLIANIPTYSVLVRIIAICSFSVWTDS